MIDAVGTMTHGDHLARIGNQSVRIEMTLDPATGLAADGLLEPWTGAPVKVEDPASPVIELLTAEVEQALDDDRRNPALLQAGPGMLRKIQHGKPSFLETCCPSYGATSSPGELVSEQTASMTVAGRFPLDATRTDNERDF
jgi:hypothetical protein